MAPSFHYCLLSALNFSQSIDKFGFGLLYLNLLCESEMCKLYWGAGRVEKLRYSISSPVCSFSSLFTGYSKKSVNADQIVGLYLQSSPL